MSRGRDDKNKKQESEIETKKDTDKIEAITAAEENTESETHTGTEEKTDSAEIKRKRRWGRKKGRICQPV